MEKEADKSFKEKNDSSSDKSSNNSSSDSFDIEQPVEDVVTEQIEKQKKETRRKDKTAEQQIIPQKSIFENNASWTEEALAKLNVKILKKFAKENITQHSFIWKNMNKSQLISYIIKVRTKLLNKNKVETPSNLIQKPQGKLPQNPEQQKTIIERSDLQNALAFLQVDVHPFSSQQKFNSVLQHSKVIGVNVDNISTWEYDKFFNVHELEALQEAEFKISEKLTLFNDLKVLKEFVCKNKNKTFNELEVLESEETQIENFSFNRKRKMNNGNFIDTNKRKMNNNNNKNNNNNNNNNNNDNNNNNNNDNNDYKNDKKGSDLGNLLAKNSIQLNSIASNEDGNQYVTAGFPDLIEITNKPCWKQVMDLILLLLPANQIDTENLSKKEIDKKRYQIISKFKVGKTVGKEKTHYLLNNLIVNDLRISFGYHYNIDNFKYMLNASSRKARLDFNKDHEFVNLDASNYGEIIMENYLQNKKNFFEKLDNNEITLNQELLNENTHLIELTEQD